MEWMEIGSYNKYVFGDGHMHFPCPLLLTTMHFAIQWFIAHVVCSCFPQSLGTDRVQNMSWGEWASVSIPCGMITALDVGLSNLALVTITLTFYTMVKSSTPVFVLGWAYLFKIERITWPLVGVVLVIAAGEFFTVYGEVDFQLHGFLLCLTASILSGARWTLVQLKLQRLDPPLKSTIVTMKLLAPSMFWSMLLISMVLERPWTKLQNADHPFELLLILSLGLVGGLLAVVMILCEFFLILRASALILMIGGVVKELTTIAIGVSYFGDTLNVVNATGVCIVFSGVLLYKVVFHYEKDARRAEAVPTIDDDNDYEQELVSKISSDVICGGFSDTPDKKYDDRDGLMMSPRSSGQEMGDSPNLHLRAARHTDSGGEDSDENSTGVV
jgi:solute carrier family 35 protein C2